MALKKSGEEYQKNHVAQKEWEGEQSLNELEENLANEEIRDFRISVKSPKLLSII